MGESCVALWDLAAVPSWPNLNVERRHLSVRTSLVSGLESNLAIVLTYLIALMSLPIYSINPMRVLNININVPVCWIAHKIFSIKYALYRPNSLQYIPLGCQGKQTQQILSSLHSIETLRSFCMRFICQSINQLWTLLRLPLTYSGHSGN